jgi:DNA-binding NarL/FixJ family response regulator
VITVLVVDDQALLREGLVALLGLVDDVRVVGVAADGAEAVRVATEQRPDVVLMDLRMPGLSGVDATARIRAELPATRVVVLTTYAEDADILAALGAGALGYLTKDAGRVQIEQAIRAAAAGQAVLDPRVQRKLLAAAASGRAPLPDGLTRRESEVLRLIAQGLSNREIGRRLVVSDATVKTHINRVFAKTGARNRDEAVRYARQHRLV